MKTISVAFIPFCKFGDEFIGIQHVRFPFPLCDKFRPKYLNSQVCYDFDINELKDLFTSNNIRKGFTLFVDNNEDRQFSWNILKDKDKPNFSVYLDTLG